MYACMHVYIANYIASPGLYTEVAIAIASYTL